MEVSDLQEFDFDGYEMCGDGATAFVYQNKNKPNILVKLFKESVTFEAAEAEYSKALNVAKLGISTPEVYGFYKIKNQFAITYRKLSNKISFARAIANEPEKLEEYIRVFAAESKKLLSTECDTSFFTNQKKRYEGIINRAQVITEDERKKILSFLNSISDATTCIHGDLHTGNIILENGKPYWIDLGYFGYGNPIFDLSTLYFLFYVRSNTPFTQNNFHNSEEQLKKCWYYFAKYYYGFTNDDEFQKINKSLDKYTIFFVFQTIVEAGVCLPQDVSYLKGIIATL